VDGLPRASSPCIDRLAIRAHQSLHADRQLSASTSTVFMARLSVVRHRRGGWYYRYSSIDKNLSCTGNGVRTLLLFVGLRVRSQWIRTRRPLPIKRQCRRAQRGVDLQSGIPTQDEFYTEQISLAFSARIPTTLIRSRWESVTTDTAGLQNKIAAGDALSASPQSQRRVNAFKCSRPVNVWQWAVSNIALNGFGDPIISSVAENVSAARELSVALDP